jgi:hypothetical protein
VRVYESTEFAWLYINRKSFQYKRISP